MRGAHGICIKTAAFLFAAVFACPVCADSEEDSGAISVVSISATTDSDDGSDYFLDANIAIPHQRRLVLSLGQQLIKSRETDRQIEPYSVLVGLESDYDAKMPLGVELQYWDDQEHINVKTLRGTLGYSFDRGNISFKPQFREFNFVLNNTHEYSSEGFTINVGAEFLSNLYVYGEYGKHYYSSKLLDLAEILLIFDFVRLKLTSSVGFAGDIYSLGGSLYLARGNLSGYWIQSVSAIDQTNTYNYGASLELDVGQAFSLALSLGTQSYEYDYPDYRYGTLALSYYW